MNSLRKSKLAFALLFVVAALSGVDLHAQQPIHGKFSLAQQVRWGAAVIPAGTYEFSSNTTGPSRVLLLQKVDRPATGFMVLSNSIETNVWSGPSGLTLVSQGKENFVSSIRLSQYGVVMNFPVPRESEKQMAQLPGTPIASAAQ